MEHVMLLLPTTMSRNKGKPATVSIKNGNLKYTSIKTKYEVYINIIFFQTYMTVMGKKYSLLGYDQKS